MATPEEMLQTMINNMPKKTGKSLEEWRSVLKESGLLKHGEFMKILKGDYGVTHGFANTISQLYLNPERLEKRPQGDNADQELLKGKEAIAEIFQKAKSQFEAIKGDVEFSYKKTYISLRTPKKQFALLQPSTKTRVDVGLNLKGVAPEGIVEAAGSWNAMVSHRVKLTDANQVDKNLSEWLQKSYDANC
jgi:predicted transport protein